jgi:hypothetical protein
MDRSYHIEAHTTYMIVPGLMKTIKKYNQYKGAVVRKSFPVSGRSLPDSVLRREAYVCIKLW